MNPGKLYLIPTIIAEETESRVLPASVLEAIGLTEIFLAENIRTARRFIAGLKLFPSVEALIFLELNKDTTSIELAERMTHLGQGKNVSIISESGCPGIADPGALAVAYAHSIGAKVIPLVGPSSILLALMASGLNGQRFSFQGYLPVDKTEVTGRIKELERESKKNDSTQIFIETPYRNNSMLANLLRTLSNPTRLTIALGITGKEEFIHTKTISEWKKNVPELAKVPAIFLFQA